MGGHKIHKQHHPHFLTFTIVEWVDVFTKKIYKDIIIESLRFCIINKGLSVHAFVIMTNHIHLIAQTKNKSGLSGFVRDFKKYTAYSLLKAIKTESDSRKYWMDKIFKHYGNKSSSSNIKKFWRRSNHPIELESPKWFRQKINYIHNNPVKAGFVKKPEHYIYSSASNYVSGKGIMDIKIVDFGFGGV